MSARPYTIKNTQPRPYQFNADSNQQFMNAMWSDHGTIDFKSGVSVDTSGNISHNPMLAAMPMSQPMMATMPMSQPLPHLMSQSVPHPMSQSMPHPMSHSMPQPMSVDTMHQLSPYMAQNQVYPPNAASMFAHTLQQSAPPKNEMTLEEASQKFLEVLKNHPEQQHELRMQTIKQSAEKNLKTGKVNAKLQSKKTIGHGGFTSRS